jgi:cytochrome P450
MAASTQAHPVPGTVPEGAPPATGLPPGPKLHAFAQTVIWALAPTWLLERCVERLGQSFTLTFWPSEMRMVLLADPQAVKDVFTAPAELAPSAAASSPVAPVLGPNSVIVLTGPEHLRQRKLLLPPFHGERMREYEQVIVEATRRDMAGWPLGRPMRVLPHTRRITLEVILRAVFGVEGERMAELKQAMAELLRPASTLRILRFALSPRMLERPGGQLGRTLDRVDELVYDELARRRRMDGLDARTDILSLLMQARDEQGEPMSDAELRDELVTLLLAGHETTATSVAWAVERLARHPDALARLTAEIDEGAGDNYLTAVANETLRVRPVVPLVVRTLTEEMAVGGRVLPAGTRVAPCIYLTNRSARVYDDPGAFRPERFLHDPPETFSWIPFGGGIRRCIGAAFAQLEMNLILRTVLAELRPRPAPLRGMRGERVRRRAITLVPAAGTTVVWERRAR